MRFLAIFILVVSLIFGCSGESEQQSANESNQSMAVQEQEQKSNSDVMVKTEKPTQIPQDQFKETESGLKYAIINEGSGTPAKKGDVVKVHYTGWLTNGKRFDSSVLRDQPFQFTLGEGRVIPGWEEGVATMKPGGVRQLILPPHLAYGERGAGGVIPPNSTLIFEVQLLAVK